MSESRPRPSTSSALLPNTLTLNNINDPFSPTTDTAMVQVFDITHQSPMGSAPCSGLQSMTTSMTSMTASWGSMTSEGMHCYGNERQTLTQLGRFCNSRSLSDVKLKVGERSYRAHKLILSCASDVFERMLGSEEWRDSTKHEVELHEEPECHKFFIHFLKYLYTSHVILNQENVLPILILADKYNVIDLREVCVHFARTYTIPRLQLKEVFHVWFQYATRCHHRVLISACVATLSERMDDISLSEEWDTEWLGLDRCQLLEFLQSSDLVVKDEWYLWEAVLRWLQVPSRASQLESNLSEVLHHIRFPMMTAEQLCELEKHPLAERFRHLFMPHVNLAYKYLSLSLGLRTTVKEFHGSAFLLRNYSEVRWDKRLVISNYSTFVQGSEVLLRFTTRACTIPMQTWDWELKVYPKGYTMTSQDCRMILSSNVILDHPRPVEFQLAIVDEQKMLVLVNGTKSFSKNRYSADMEMEKKVNSAELSSSDSPFLINNNLVLQVSFRPVG